MRDEKSNKSLFSRSEQANIASAAPLAVRMRPRNLGEFLGQRHFLGPGKLLTRMLEADRLTSLIFYGPPGVGKTSLAAVIANYTKAKFHYLSAPAASVRDIREIIAAATDRLATGGQRTVLFIDEIHRFNRAQQDVLLDDVEEGVLILIGATTENPFFAVNSPLISRSTVFHFEPLEEPDILRLLRTAITDPERGLGKLNVEADEEALKFLSVASDGDARRALTALEVGVLSQAAHHEENDSQSLGQRAQSKTPFRPNKGHLSRPKGIKFNLEVAKESIQQKVIDYDGTGDTHYDLASALQKSMRGSDPDATVYWLARMIAGGEDTRFIARRIAVCAAEDVGNADPMATVLASAAVQISEFVGLPEAQLALAQAAIYVACAPKSNAAASAIWRAVDDVKSQKTIAVPQHLKDSHYPAAKKLGYGADYKYPHNFKNGFVPQEYLSAKVRTRYYKPKEIGYEKDIRRYLQKLQSLIKDHKPTGGNTPKQDN
ncbi:MAG: replication-associated recombination protein A [Planctomycetota bacterium]|nr:MAG: replication-associated recombination protein A [Planctomycetota bacterium]